VVFSKENVLKMGMMKGYHPYHLERDDRNSLVWEGPKGVGSTGLRVRMEDCRVSYKDQFVIFHYLYTYQVQPVDTIWEVACFELARSTPQGYRWLGSTGWMMGNVSILVRVRRWPCSILYNH
jgi:hypothetical protein